MNNTIAGGDLRAKRHVTIWELVAHHVMNPLLFRSGLSEQ
jgi:hypothetical protein